MLSCILLNLFFSPYEYGKSNKIPNKVPGNLAAFINDNEEDKFEVGFSPFLEELAGEQGVVGAGSEFYLCLLRNQAEVFEVKKATLKSIFLDIRKLQNYLIK